MDILVSLLMSAEGLLSGVGGLPGSLPAFSGASPGTLQPFLQPGIRRHPEQSIPAPGTAAHSYLPLCWADVLLLQLAHMWWSAL